MFPGVPIRDAILGTVVLGTVLQEPALPRNRRASPGLHSRRPAMMTDLLLKSSGPVADQYKVLAGDLVVGHIRLSESAPPTTSWRWTLSHGQHKGRRTPTHGYGATREEAMQAFARSWHRE